MGYKYKLWIASKPCIVGRKCLGQVIPAHYRTRGAGHGEKNNLFPLCVKHHSEQHTCGIKTFQKKYNLDLKEACKRYWEEYNSESE